MEELTGMVQSALSPAAMVSGAGLLVLSMTNRFAHFLLSTDCRLLLVLSSAPLPPLCHPARPRLLVKRV